MLFGIGQYSEVQKNVQIALKTFDSKNSKNFRIQQIFDSMDWSQNSWSNRLTCGADMYFKTKLVTQVLKEEVFKKKMELLPSLRMQIKDFCDLRMTQKQIFERLSQDPAYSIFKKNEINHLVVNYERWRQGQRGALTPVLQGKITQLKKQGKSPIEILDVIGDDPRFIFLKKNELREVLYAAFEMEGIFESLMSLRTADLQEAAAYFTEETHSVPHADACDWIARAALALRIHPEFFSTLPKRIQELYQTIGNSRRLVQYIAGMIQNALQKFQPLMEEIQGETIVSHAKEFVRRNPKADELPNLEKDRSRSHKKVLQLILDPKKPISVDFMDRKTFLEQMKLLAVHLNPNQPDLVFILQQLVMNEQYGRPIGFLKQALWTQTEKPYFSCANGDQDTVDLTLTQKSPDELEARYSFRAHITDPMHMYHHAFDERHLGGEVRLESSYTLKRNAETREFEVHGPIIDPATFSFDK